MDFHGVIMVRSDLIDFISKNSLGCFIFLATEKVTKMFAAVKADDVKDALLKVL